MPTKSPKCVNCGDRDTDGVTDAYGRFWCEDCVIFILADLTPEQERGRRHV